MSDADRVWSALVRLRRAHTSEVAKATGLGYVPTSLALHSLWRAGRATHGWLFGWEPGGEVSGVGGGGE